MGGVLAWSDVIALGVSTLMAVLSDVTYIFFSFEAALYSWACIGFHVSGAVINISLLGTDAIIVRMGLPIRI